MIGLSKKLLIADVLELLVRAVYGMMAAELDARTAWLGILAYALQIYFDFSGYSDMAIGLGQLFGFSFRENFEHPYAAGSLRDFWRRWHISLSSWFRDYVYIPLGGNRRGRGRTCLNVLLVFFLTGLWHGANWTFVVWGLWHGCFVMLENWKRIPPDRLSRRTKGLGHAYTMLVVVLGFAVFRADSLSGAAMLLGQLFDFSFTAASRAALAQTADPYTLFTLALGCLLSLPVLDWLKKHIGPRGRSIAETLSYPGVLAPYVLDLMHLAAAAYVPFIYFQF